MKNNSEENVSPQQRNSLCSGLTLKTVIIAKSKNQVIQCSILLVSYVQKKYRRHAFGFACVSLVALQSAFSGQGQGQVKAEKITASLDKDLGAFSTSSNLS